MQTRSCRNRWTGSCEINLDRFLFIMPSCVCQKIRSRVASSPAAAPVPCLARCGLQPLLPSPSDGLPCSVSLPAEPSVRAPLVFPSPAPQMLTATSLFSATSSPFEIPRAFFRRRKAVSVQAVAGYGRGLRLEAQSEPRRKAAWFRGAHRRPAALHGLLNMPCQRCTQARGTAWRQEAGAQNVIARAWRPTKDAASCLPRPPVSAGASGRAHVFPSLSSSKRDVPGQASTPGRGNPLGSRRDDCTASCSPCHKARPLQTTSMPRPSLICTSTFISASQALRATGASRRKRASTRPGGSAQVGSAPDVAICGVGHTVVMLRR